jgi:hypothetical protein
MSCLPNTPVAANVLTATNSTDHGWQNTGTVITTALSQYYPVMASVITLTGLAQTTQQHAIIRQIEFEETASSSANIKKCPLIVLLYNSTAPTTPTSGAVYNGSTTNLLGAFTIADTDYKRVSDTVWIAGINPDKYVRTGTVSTSSTFYAVVLSNSATSVTYAASAAARLRLFTEALTAL